MKEIISDFFIPVAANEGFLNKISQWTKRQGDYPWDISVFKVIDNLVIGSMKLEHKNAHGSG